MTYGLLVLAGVIVIVFFLFNVLPGDPARMMLGQRADQQSIDAINKELGRDRSLAVQFIVYLNELSPISIHSINEESSLALHPEKYDYSKIAEFGDKLLIVKVPYLGRSYQSRKKVTEILGESLPETTVLAISAILIAAFLGIFLGLISAIFKDGWMDRTLLVLATSGMALPSFFVGIIFAWLFGFVLAEYTGLNMTGSLYEVDDLGRGEYIQWSNLILPALTLGIRPLAVIIQLSRNSFIDVMGQDYIRTARAKGLSYYTVLGKHAMQNALNPVLTAISGMFASLMAGAVFIEIIFAWKGIGYEIVTALEKYDFPVVMGAVLVIAFIFVLINIIVDILYGILDPRVRVE